MAFILGIFLFAFRDFKLNAQIVIVMAFLAASILLCVWIVFEITGWCSILHRPKELLKRFRQPDEGNESQRPPNNKIRQATLTLETVGKIVIRLVGGQRAGVRSDGATNNVDEQTHHALSAQSNV